MLSETSSSSTVKGEARLPSPASFEADISDDLLSNHGDSNLALSGLLDKMEPPADEENQFQPSPQKHHRQTFRKLTTWILINIFATIAIVFINKAIFDDPSFRGAQLSFASFHFFITFSTLHIVSSPGIAFFERRRARIQDVLPLATAMCLNVILPNLSLAFSSVTFYQTVRVLLTPAVAVLNFALYGTAIPRQAAYTLVPVCVGVAMVTHYDVRPAVDGADITHTSPLGVFFAIAGVLASSVYTVWIAFFHKKLEMTSVQLLHNQALVGATMLLYFIPFIDTLPAVRDVAMSRWFAILMVSFVGFLYTWVGC